MVFPQNDHLYKGHHISVAISTKKVKDKVSHLQDNIQGVISLGDWCLQGDVGSLFQGSEPFLCVTQLCELMTGIGQLPPHLPADHWPKDSCALVARVSPQSRQEKKQGTIQEPQILFWWSSHLAPPTPEPAQGGHSGPLTRGLADSTDPVSPQVLKKAAFASVHRRSQT